MIARTSLVLVVVGMLLTWPVALTAASTTVATTLGVETSAPSDVTDSSATLRGNLTGLGGADNVTVWFEFWEQGDPANASATSNQTVGSVGEFNATVPGLVPNTTYVYVAYADDNGTTVTGSEVAFTTDVAPLGVETLAASGITNTSATLNGKLTGLGDASTASVWFEYWPKGDQGNASNTSEQMRTSPGNFSAVVSGLDNETTYVYVAYAEANNTTVSGAMIEFTTGAQNGDDGNVTGPFGLRVSAFVHSLQESLGPGNHSQPLGRMIADWVTEHNPGNPPDHAGPNGDNGNGPPDHAKNDEDNGNNGNKGGNGKGKAKGHEDDD